MHSEDSYSLERLRDRFQIQDLLYRIARSVDRCDYAAMRECFHPDSFDDHGAYAGGPEGYIAFSRERNQTIPASMHLLGNMLIEFTATDSALVESYLWSVQLYPPEARQSLEHFLPKGAAPDGAVNSLGAVRYVDRIDRRDGAWKIKHRTVLMDWKALTPATGPTEFSMFKPSSRGPDDWLFQERRALGLE